MTGPACDHPPAVLAARAGAVWCQQCGATVAVQPCHRCADTRWLLDAGSRHERPDGQPRTTGPAGSGAGHLTRKPCPACTAV